MCTAATYNSKDFYFGRTLDYEFSYGDSIVIMPRNFPLVFRSMGRMENHYAMIGMAHVEDGCPLFYDAVNEKGLGMAGLNFVGNAFYRDKEAGKDNVSQFEFISWILSQCDSVGAARALLERINIDNEQFNERLPAAQLHWIIADKDGAITVESVREGLRVYDNPAGVLTNNPPFDMQMMNLNNYMGLSPKDPENSFSDKLNLSRYSRGMGGMGLPGDLSSQSRFVRVAFVKMNSVSGESEKESVSQFFHILNSVDQQRGCCDVGGGKCFLLYYSICLNQNSGKFLYRCFPVFIAYECVKFLTYSLRMSITSSRSSTL
ncbi:MAG: choloylglycine hydrolase [Oscillospiraceae bacterium]|nr:choloylglycine hydrolase [Oscillospiraceae bacterium]